MAQSHSNYEVLLREIMRDLYIGLMSGTSVDGIDAALVDLTDENPALLNTHYVPYNQELREEILGLCAPGNNEIERLGKLDITLGKAFARATKELISKQSLTASEIKAIGSHGQTIRHHPHDPMRFTLQIGDPNIIAAETGITTVADFRRKDLACGGQGAPLVPAFHKQIFSSKTCDRAIVNIGGIANITLLNNDSILGFDTGPGNTLLDSWVHLHHGVAHDASGNWAKEGSVRADLLTQLLNDPYFHRTPPKSTGREYFNLTWLNTHLGNKKYSPADVQATLVELTASSILMAIKQYLNSGEIFICGGGAKNDYLMMRLQTLAAPSFEVASTQKYGVHPDWVEATAFAWLAKETLHHRPGNLPSVTGARQFTVLGGVYFAK